MLLGVKRRVLFAPPTEFAEASVPGCAAVGAPSLDAPRPAWDEEEAHAAKAKQMQTRAVREVAEIISKFVLQPTRLQVSVHCRMLARSPSPTHASGRAFSWKSANRRRRAPATLTQTFRVKTVRGRLLLQISRPTSTPSP